MHTYLHMQEAPITDNITADGHVGSRLPWPVIADEDGIVAVPSSRLMHRVVGFQRDLALQQVDVFWSEAYADPSKVVGMYMVSENHSGKYQCGLSAVDSAELREYTAKLPVER